MTASRALELVTPDGHTLAAHLFTPAGKPRGGLLVVPAMGVPQAFYRALAEWLATEGFIAATFDFRGIGQSRRGPLSRVDTDIIRWAEQDCGAALDALATHATSLPLFWVGHSLGGQILAFVPNHARLARAVSVASGSGYVGHYRPALRRRAWVLWHVAVPAATRLTGYFPGRRLRMIGDLPRGVVEQWRRWCLHPEYSAGVEGDSVRSRYAAVRTPIVSLSFTDDEYMSPPGVAALAALYTGAPQEARYISPAEAGVGRIGHFGFFRPEHAEPLWRRYLLPELISPDR